MDKALKWLSGSIDRRDLLVGCFFDEGWMESNFLANKWQQGKETRMKEKKKQLKEKEG